MTQRLFSVFILLLCLTPFVSYAKGMGGMPPPVVQTVPAQTQSWQSEIHAIGTLSSNQGIVLKPEVSGRVTGIYFRSGDYVTAGTPLLQINPAILNAQLNSAEAKLVLSKANYTRAFELFKKRVFAQADLDNSLSAYKADLANVADMQAQLNQTLIRAPFTGKLGLRLVDMGDFVDVGDSIANLNAIDPLRIDFSIPEVYLGRLANNQTVLIHSGAYPNQIFQGKIYAMDSQIDASTRSVGVRASLPNKDHKLLPGAFVDVTVETGAPQQYVGVPETAILYDATGQFVYKVVKSVAIKSPVTTGPHKDGMVAILKGVNAGDAIITLGAFKAADGEPVMVMPPQPPAQTK